MVFIMARERQRLNQNQDTIITITRDMAMDIEDMVDTMARERLNQNQGTMDITITTTKDLDMDMADMVIMDELVSKAQTVSGVQ